MPDPGSVRVRPIVAEDLIEVLSWRNAAEVRRCMVTQHEITMEEHRRWFDRISQDATRRSIIVEEHGSPLGVAQFSGVMEGGTADWGFYLVPGAGPGSGRKLGVAALDYAFGSLAVHKVSGQVLDYNKRSIRFHEKLGFAREGVLRQQVAIQGTYYDLICFGLLRAEHEALVAGVQ